MFKSDDVQIWKMGDGHIDSPLTKMLLTVDAYWEKQKQCFLIRVSGVIGQHKMESFLCWIGFCFNFSLVCLVFVIIVLWEEGI